MQYNVVSGDSHLDLTWLPGNLFKDNAPSHLKEKVPHVVETEKGARWVAEGKELGVYGGLGFGFSAPRKNMRYRVDRMYDAGYYEGGPHPINQDLRLKDMATDGVDAEILYGMTTAGMRIKDQETLTATFRIYNEWVNDFCRSRPGRWYALACIPIHDPQAAADELRRASKLGWLRGADLYVTGTIQPIYLRDGFWDPLWKAAAECHMPISFHIGAGGIQVPLPPGAADRTKVFTGDNPSQNDLAFRGSALPLGQLSGSEWLTSIIMSGACDRYPDFRFVLGECGAGWIPFIIHRMDLKFRDQYLDRDFSPALELKPSEYWYRQGATTFQEDPCVDTMSKEIGEDNLMWGSDYPHPDGVWPDSKEIIKETMGRLKPKVLKKVICENAVRHYRMGE
ncbi:MAG: hypothetical protein FJ320_04090 [SAR202 cluster bacterium]|nr:hypothetical protein [SAR202 cluster bacterium]